MFADFQKRSLLAGLLASASLRASNDLVVAKDQLEPLIFFKNVQGKEVSLLTMLHNNQVNQFALSDPFPSDFHFPRSFEFEMTLAQQYQPNRFIYATQSSIFDSQNNRVKIERQNLVYAETNTQSKIYEFEKMQVHVADPDRGVCMTYRLEDIAPVSMVPREKDHINFEEAF